MVKSMDVNKFNQLSDVDMFDENAVVLQIHPRASTPVTLSVPDDVLALLQKVAIPVPGGDANDREMSVFPCGFLFTFRGLGRNVKWVLARTNRFDIMQPANTTHLGLSTAQKSPHDRPSAPQIDTLAIHLGNHSPSSDRATHKPNANSFLS